MNTLWVLVILSLLAFALAWRISLELKLSHYFVSQLKALYAVKAGVRYAMEIVKQDNPDYDNPNDLWANKASLFKDKQIKDGEDVDNGSFTISYIHHYENGQPVFWYGLIDEERKINLNLESEEDVRRKLYPLLVNLKQVLDNNEVMRGILTDEIINSIIDWRDSDNNLLNNPTQQEPIPSRNGKFQVLEELMLLKGIDGDVKKFEQLKKYFTIYGDDKKMNINTVEKEILEALAYCIYDTIKKMIDLSPVYNTTLKQYILDFVGAILNRRTISPFKNIDEIASLSSFQTILGLSHDVEERVKGLIINYLKDNWLKVNSSCFEVNVEAKVRTIKKKATAVFNRSTNQILYWYED